MQKKIIALAIAAAFAAPVAMAADGVTVYGVVDGGFRSATTGGVTSNTMGSGVLNSNRWGVKASEDLGGGMSANVKLEGDLTTGTGEGKANTTTTTTTTTTGATPGTYTSTSKSTTGNQLFSRQATVGIAASWGAIDLGRQYTVAYKLNTDIDPFGHQFIAITSANAASGMTYAYTTAAGFSQKNITRNDNDISYTGKFGDVTVMANKAMGDATTDSGATTAVGAKYASGPITVVASYTKVKAAASPVPVTSDMTHTQVGAGFNFGDGNVKVGYAAQSNADQGFITTGTGSFGSLLGSTLDAKSIWFGGDFNVTSAVNVVAGYYRTTFSVTGGTSDVVSTNLVAAVKYALSKKTSLYLEADKQSLDAGAGSTVVDSNGYSAGLSVSF